MKKLVMTIVIGALVFLASVQARSALGAVTTEAGITTTVEVRGSSLADTSGFPTITRTVTPVTIPMHIRIRHTPIRLRISSVCRTRPTFLLVLLSGSAGLLPVRHELSERVDEGDRHPASAGRGGCGKMRWQRGLLLFFVAAVIGGCATMPTGPSVMVLPSPGKPFEVFMADDSLCRQWAQQQIGGASPSETANKNLADGAVIGTLVGAAVGTAIGAAAGDPGGRCCHRGRCWPPRRNRDGK